MNLQATRAIIGHLVLGFTEDGWRVELSDQDGGGLYVYLAPDGKTIARKAVSHWVKLETTNTGPDIIVDYTTQPEVRAMVERTIKYAEKLQSLDE